MNIPGYTIIGPIAYQGKKGCQNVLCTHFFKDGTMSENCYGWHCSYCDEPCSSQGHRCPAGDPAVTARADDRIWQIPLGEQHPLPAWEQWATGKTLGTSLFLHHCPEVNGHSLHYRDDLDPMALGVCRYCKEPLP